MAGLRFRPAQRLRRPGEFQRAYREGRRFQNAWLSANVAPNALGMPRLGGIEVLKRLRARGFSLEDAKRVLKQRRG